MLCFVALSEDLLDELWAKSPESVAPFSRPFMAVYDSPLQMSLQLEAQAVAVMTSEREVNSTSKS
ncbi:MAG: hypothetical protein R3183_12875 [Oleiphilaceae bacterium]|nr:hypothetical protein [Oleiphilaceae bacterium]